MIPVRVRDEQGEIERLLFEFLHEREAEFAQARAAIKDDNVVVVADFDAGGVAAIADGGRPRCGNGSADTPEFYVRAFLDGQTLTQLTGKIKAKLSGRRKLKPLLREGATGSGFEIALKLTGAGAVGKGDGGLDLPRTEFCGVRHAAGIVFFQASA